MRLIRYFFEYIAIIILFGLFKLLGYRIASELGYFIGKTFGPFFRSKKIIKKNLQIAIPHIDIKKVNQITKLMWNNYGRVFAEYMFIKDFRINKLGSNIQVEGKEILDNLKKNNKSAVFISGHFANFELMAMFLEKNGLNLCAVYRPLNNIFINQIMEKIRKKYICKNQVKKGIGGMKNLINLTKQNFSIALMIDQRVSEGIKSKFFNKEAYTTTIPGQLVKKFNMPIIPVHIERFEDVNFKIKIYNPMYFDSESSVESITNNLNKTLENMIRINPEQWIWSHNRWK